jgi:hypothetical protein
MNTSQITTLSAPIGDDPIPVGSLGYFRARNRHRLYSLIIDEFEQSGISQATLARRLRKSPEVICRWLGAPGNWRLDTISDLLFAIDGGEANYSVQYPLELAPRNDTAPEWTFEEPPQQPIARTQTETDQPRQLEPA